MKKQAAGTISNELGYWHISAWSDEASTYFPHLILTHQGPDDAEGDSPTLVRIHSECITGDLFHSTRCDCGEQLWRAMTQIARKGGHLLYLRQEGRGIGIIEKLKAYNLQDKGYDTVAANTMLGHDADGRSYEIAIEILRKMDVTSIDLLTNNPQKVKAFEDGPISVHRRIPLVVEPREENADYLSTKEKLMGHIFGR